MIRMIKKFNYHIFQPYFVQRDFSFSFICHFESKIFILYIIVIFWWFYGSDGDFLNALILIYWKNAFCAENFCFDERPETRLKVIDWFLNCFKIYFWNICWKLKNWITQIYLMSFIIMLFYISILFCMSNYSRAWTFLV